MMNTPICDFVKKYASKGKIRLHMPGHKGKNIIGGEMLDITEIDGADVLYHSNGIINQSQQNASKLFGTKRTVYSVEGSSLCIRAMVYLSRIYAESNGQRAHILAFRNAHKSFICAAALLDVDVTWLFPEITEGLASCKITAQRLEEKICKMSQKPTAVFITSPDYLGNIAPISEISAVCRKYGVLLFVDNAHGAYLKFLPQTLHPMDLGADVCCDSAHKTLPCLTAGAYLHISHTSPAILGEMAETAMSLFATTSPSYLCLQSLDALNAYLDGDFSKELQSFCKRVDALKQKLENMGYVLVGDETLKLTFSTKPYGYTGQQFAEILNENDMVCEFYDNDYVVLMLSVQLSDDIFEKIEQALAKIPPKTPLCSNFPKIAIPLKKMSANKAMLSVSEELDVKDCLGRIMASPTVSCPPAIPVVVCGEEIDATAIEVFHYYGIEKCSVVLSKE